MTTHTLRLDVRPILASRQDPFAEIMRAAGNVPVDGFLVVVAPFDPVPLREKLGASGFTSTAVSSGPQGWEITFHRAAAKIPAGTLATILAPAAPPNGVEKSSPPQPAVWTDRGEVHLNARGFVRPPRLAPSLRRSMRSAVVGHLSPTSTTTSMRSTRNLYNATAKLRSCQASVTRLGSEISTPPVDKAWEKGCAGASESLDPQQRTRAALWIELIHEHRNSTRVPQRRLRSDRAQSGGRSGRQGRIHRRRRHVHVLEAGRSVSSDSPRRFSQPASNLSSAY